MNAPRRWLESEEKDSELLLLLEAAPRPRSMNGAEQRRSARTLARMAALPASIAFVIWLIRQGARRFGFWVAAGGAMLIAAGALPAMLQTSKERDAPPVVDAIHGIDVSPLPSATPPVLVPSSPSIGETDSEPQALRGGGRPSRVLPSQDGESASSLAEEATLLDRARRELQR